MIILALNKINKGQTDWHIPLNENFAGIADGSLLPENLLKTDNKGNALVKKTLTIQGEIGNEEKIPQITFQHGETEDDGNNNLIYSVPWNNVMSLRSINPDSIQDTDTGKQAQEYAVYDFFPSGKLQSSITKNGETTSKDIWNGHNFPLEQGRWFPEITDNTKETFKADLEKTVASYYYRMGPLCFVQSTFSGVVTATGSGQLIIKGCPFVGKDYAPLATSHCFIGSRIPRFSVYSLGYIGALKEGEWLTFDVSGITVGTSLAFSFAGTFIIG